MIVIRDRGSLLIRSRTVNLKTPHSNLLLGTTGQGFKCEEGLVAQVRTCAEILQAHLPRFPGLQGLHSQALILTAGATRSTTTATTANTSSSSSSSVAVRSSTEARHPPRTVQCGAQPPAVGERAHHPER